MVNERGQSSKLDVNPADYGIALNNALPAELANGGRMNPATLLRQ